MSHAIPEETNQTKTNQSSLTKIGAGVLGAITLPAGIAAGAFATGNETIKIALIGCGGRGTGAVAQALSTTGAVQLWAMADTFSDRLESSLKNLTKGAKARYDAKKHNGFKDRIDVPPERRFIGLDAYRKAIDSGVDLIIHAAAPGYRPLHFEYAINAGKHVFMEKPVASDPHGIRKILATAELAKKKGLKVGVGLQRHHQKEYLDIIPKIQNGAIGDIIALRCYWNTSAPAKKPFPHEGLTELEYQIRNWYFFSWLSGDHICEQHVHNLDVCNWIMQGHPVEAEGMGGREVRTGKEYGNIFDHHWVEFTYANGTKMISQCRQIPGCQRAVSEYVQGSEGTASLGNKNQAMIKKGNKVTWRSSRKKRTNPYQVEHDVLFDAIRNDKEHNEATYGATSTMTAILGRLATYSGKKVRWDDAIGSDIKLTSDAEDWKAKAPVYPDENGFYPVAIPGITKVV